MSKRGIYDQEPPSLPLRLLACDDLGLLKGELFAKGRVKCSMLHLS